MICICCVIVIKSMIIMKCAHYNKFTTNYLWFAYFHCFRHKYFKLLKYSVSMGRYEPETFSYTKEIESRYFLYGTIIQIWPTFLKTRSSLLLHLKRYKLYGFPICLIWTRYFVCMKKCDDVIRLWHFFHIGKPELVFGNCKNYNVDNMRPDFVSISYVTQFRLPFRVKHHGKLQMPPL